MLRCSKVSGRRVAHLPFPPPILITPCLVPDGCFPVLTCSHVGVMNVYSPCHPDSTRVRCHAYAGELHKGRQTHFSSPSCKEYSLNLCPARRQSPPATLNPADVPLSHGISHVSRAHQLLIPNPPRQVKTPQPIVHQTPNARPSARPTARRHDSAADGKSNNDGSTATDGGGDV